MAKKVRKSSGVKKNSSVSARSIFDMPSSGNEESEFSTPFLSDTNDDLARFADVAKERHSRNFFIALIASVALVSGLISFGLAQQFKTSVGENTTLAAKTSGGVCLSEKELIKLVTAQKLTAYWAGPVSGATYSINALQSGQVFIRYVQKGQKCDSQNRDFRVIATYAENGAFDSTKAAGSQANGVSLANQDGSIVYFSKDSPTNVYLAFPSIDYQIEIYDPDPKVAVSLATTVNKIQLIKG